MCGLPQGLFRPGDVVLVHWGRIDCFLRDVHSPASVREMIQQENAKLAVLTPIKEE